MRRWFQVRLLTLLAVTLLVSLPLAWFANARTTMRTEEAAIARLGAKKVDWIRPTPRWLTASKKPSFNNLAIM